MTKNSEPQLLQEFESLAGLVSCRNNLSVVVGESHDCAWSFNWKTGCITVNPADLLMRPRDFLLGLVIHEAGHAGLTRLHHMVPRSLLENMAIHMLLNAIEDCRIESALVERLPGCDPWVKLYNNTLFADLLEIDSNKMEEDQAGGFLASILCRWWYGKYPASLPNLARNALDEAWPYIELAIAARPPSQCPDPLETRRKYERHPVHVCYRGVDESDELSPMELEVRMSQYEMWEIVWRKILPIFQTLIEKAMSPLGVLARFLQEMKIRVVTVMDREASNGVAASSDLNDAAARSRFECLAGFAKQRLAQISAGQRDYHEAQLRYHEAIERITHEMLETLTAISRPRRQRFFRSGQQLDTRQAMQYEANPELHDTLWMRQNIPSKPDPAFMILADASHSMMGEKAYSTFNALVMLRESCLRIGIPLTIIIFDSGARVAQAWFEPCSNTTVSMLCSLRNHPGGGTNMTQGLMLACEQATSMPNRDRHLWLLSDGEPDDFIKTKCQIQQAREHFRSITALGLGPDTESLKKLIPHSLTNLSSEELPGLAGRIFKRMACQTG